MTTFASLMKTQVSIPVKSVKLKQSQFVHRKHFLRYQLIQQSQKHK